MKDATCSIVDRVSNSRTAERGSRRREPSTILLRPFLSLPFRVARSFSPRIFSLTASSRKWSEDCHGSDTRTTWWSLRSSRQNLWKLSIIDWESEVFPLEVDLFVFSWKLNPLNLPFAIPKLCLMAPFSPWTFVSGYRNLGKRGDFYGLLAFCLENYSLFAISRRMEIETLQSVFSFTLESWWFLPQGDCSWFVLDKVICFQGHGRSSTIRFRGIVIGRKCTSGKYNALTFERYRQEKIIISRRTIDQRFSYFCFWTFILSKHLYLFRRCIKNEIYNTIHCMFLPTYNAIDIEVYNEF